MIITSLGYEEIRRINEERQRRSIQRQQTIRALAETPTAPSPRPDCEVIEWDFGVRMEGQEKKGA